MIGKPCMLVLTKLHCPPSLCEHMVNQLHGTKQKSLPQRVVGSPVVNLVLLFVFVCTIIHFYSSGAIKTGTSLIVSYLDE